MTIGLIAFVYAIAYAFAHVAYVAVAIYIVIVPIMLPYASEVLFTLFAGATLFFVVTFVNFVVTTTMFWTLFAMVMGMGGALFGVGAIAAAILPWVLLIAAVILPWFLLFLPILLFVMIAVAL